MADEDIGCARPTGSLVGEHPAKRDETQVVLHPGPDLVGRVWEVWQPREDE